MTQTTVSPARPTSSAPVPANNRFLVGIAVGALVTLGAVAMALGTGAAARVASFPAGPAESRSYAQPVDGVSRANVHLQFGAGQLNLGALEIGHSSLATASVAGPSNHLPEPTYRVRDGVGELTYAIRDDQMRLPFFRGSDEDTRMNVQLARNTPFMLNVETGASESALDLSALQITRLDLRTGVADTRVRLPQAAGQTSVAAKGGITDLTFEVPQGVAADIQVSDGMASRAIDEQRFRPLGGGHYRSADYDSASNRIDLHIELGMATLTIR
jgi:hypothetical protein